MKINMYPPCPQPQLALGVETHTDMSAITILVPNDVPGLQIWKDGNWVAVNCLPNALFVNCLPNALFVHTGDQIEVKCFVLPANSENVREKNPRNKKNILLLGMKGQRTSKRQQLLLVWLLGKWRGNKEDEI